MRQETTLFLLMMYIIFVAGCSLVSINISGRDIQEEKRINTLERIEDASQESR